MLLVYDKSIWQNLCRRVFEPASALKTLQNEVKVYGNDWLTMFLEKPRIKFHGVYISRVNYLRQGYTETFNQPIHLVGLLLICRV